LYRSLGWVPVHTVSSRVLMNPGPICPLACVQLLMTETHYFNVH